jgi:DNA-binding response OmpR family regulator
MRRPISPADTPSRVASSQTAKIAQHLGAVDAIAKPFDSDDLLRRVRVCLNGR